MSSSEASRVPPQPGTRTTGSERRRAQNRASQKKYRARQKLKMEVAKAVLLEGQYPDLAQLQSLRSSAGLSDEHIDLSDLLPEGVNASGQFKSLHDMIDLDAGQHHHGGAGGGDFPGQLSPRGSTPRGGSLDYGSSGLPSSASSTSVDMDSIYVASDQAHYGNYTVSPSGIMGDAPSLGLNGIDTSLEPLHLHDPSMTSTEWLDKPDDVLAHSPPGVNHSFALTPGNTYGRATRAGGPPSGVHPPSTASSTSPSASDTAALLNTPDTQCNTHESSSSSRQDASPRCTHFSTPLLTAIALGNLEIASLLIKSGAQLDPSALPRSIERGDDTMACRLLDLGASVATPDTEEGGDAAGEITCVHVAVGTNDEEMVRTLLRWFQRKDEEEEVDKGSGKEAESGKNKKPGRLLRDILNRRRANGMTAVHQAVSLQYLGIVRILLDFGADVNLGNE